MRTSGVMPRRVASASLISTTAAAPSLMPEALAAVTVPSLSKAGFSFWIGLERRAGADVLVLVDDVSPLRPLIVYRDDLVLEPAGLLRRLRLVLRGDARNGPAPRGVSCHWRATFSAVVPM